MKCIMPEMPYCPACKFGYIVMHENNDTDCGWICLYDPDDIPMIEKEERMSKE